MGKTPVWSDMVSDTTVDTTGTNTVTVKSTGYQKSRVSVCLTAKEDGTKLTQNCLQWLSSRMQSEKSMQWIKGSKIIPSSPNT